MADVNLSPYTAEQQAMDRRRKMAEAMQQQAVAPIEMPTVPGAKVSHLQGLAKLLQGYIAGKNLDRADQEQKDYENKVSQETADLLSKMSQYQTVKGEQVSPAVPAEIIPAVENQENLDRKNTIVYNFSHRTNEKPSIGMVNNGTRLDESGRNTFMPSSVTGQQIRDADALPRYTSEEQIKTPAKPATYAADRQEPVLNASYLDPTKPYAYKAGQVKQMLMQVLMQQEAQKQAAAQAEAAAARQIHAFDPEKNLGTFSGGKFNIISQGQPKSLTEYQNYDLQLKDAANRVTAAKIEDATGVKQEPYTLLPSGIPFGAVKSGKETPDGRPVYKKDGKFYVEGK